MSFNGSYFHKSAFGRCLTIAIFTVGHSTVGDACAADRIGSPDFTKQPLTVNYSNDRYNMTVDMKQNMVAYQINTVNDLSIDFIEQHLRVFFLDDDDDLISSSRCENYFSDEIQAESKGK